MIADRNASDQFLFGDHSCESRRGDLFAWNHFYLFSVGKIDVEELVVDSNRQPLVSFRVALNEVKRFIGSPVARGKLLSIKQLVRELNENESFVSLAEFGERLRLAMDS